MGWHRHHIDLGLWETLAECIDQWQGQYDIAQESRLYDQNTHTHLRYLVAFTHLLRVTGAVSLPMDGTPAPLHIPHQP
jgi:hypothetical protein